MRLPLVAAAVSVVLAAPGLAAAESVQVTVRLDIPVSCGARLIEAVPVGDTVEVSVRRTCNTPHALTLTGVGMDQASITELNSSEVRPADRAVFRHGGLVSNTVDRFVIEGAADPIRAASELQVSIAVL